MSLLSILIYTSYNLQHSDPRNHRRMIAIELCTVIYKKIVKRKARQLKDDIAVA